MSLILKISAGILLAAVVIIAWNTWRGDAEDREFSGIMQQTHPRWVCREDMIARSLA
jgi:hypothetical protein